MKLYHGSNVYIETPDLLKSKPFKDFGRGFYLSPDIIQAQARARQMVELIQEGEPIVTSFEWEEHQAIATGLNIKRFEDYSREWAEFVLANRDRQRHTSVHNFDIVIGPIADDGVTYQLRRYNRGDISMERLIQELKYAKGLTIQYFFGTERALKTLKRL